MNKLKKLDDDFEKVRWSHLSIQHDFINKMQFFQFNKEYGASVLSSLYDDKFKMVCRK
jgi:hypothetical protein